MDKYFDHHHFRFPFTLFIIKGKKTYEKIISNDCAGVRSECECTG